MAKGVATVCPGDKPHLSQVLLGGVEAVRGEAAARPTAGCRRGAAASRRAHGTTFFPVIGKTRRGKDKKGMPTAPDERSRLALPVEGRRRRKMLFVSGLPGRAPRP
jgi:hypothetical protein